MTNQSIEEYSQYLERYKDYDFEMYWPSNDSFDSQNQHFMTNLKTKDGSRYVGEFMTLKFVNNLFKKNQKTQENASGSYLILDTIILLRNGNRETIKSTIDDLIANRKLEKYFEKIN
jgi:hypothetical protein